jgi:hypothetical protein
MTRRRVICGHELVGAHNCALTCSQLCRDERRREKQLAYRKKARNIILAVHKLGLLVTDEQLCERMSESVRERKGLIDLEKRRERERE